MSCGTYQAGAAHNYKCTYTATLAGDTGGAQTIVIDTLDEAGNADSAVATVVFDFNALTLNQTLSPNPAKANATPVLAITLDKAITAAPAVSFVAVGSVTDLSERRSFCWSRDLVDVYVPDGGRALAGKFNITTNAVDTVDTRPRRPRSSMWTRASRSSRTSTRT